MPDLRNDKIKVNDTLYINTMSLDYGGYGEIGEYHPVSKKSPNINLISMERVSMMLIWVKAMRNGGLDGCAVRRLS